MTAHENNIPSLAGADLVSRRFSGPAADEIYLQCRPHSDLEGGFAQQVARAYQAMAARLRPYHGSLNHLVYETVCFRNIRRDFETFQHARRQNFAVSGDALPHAPASTCIEQPPLDGGADLAISAVAIIPRAQSSPFPIPGEPHTGCSLMLGRQKHLFAGSIFGRPGTAFDQTYGMFCRAEEVLRKEGMRFPNVIRTWIYLRHMERDYGEFNRGRREFFRQRGIVLLPASTGIYASPFPVAADFVLSMIAIQSPQPVAASAMTTPTLNEACTYGSDFSRGLRVVEENKIGLYISGTASVDEEGRTAHVDDFDGQVERMLVNVETLMAAHHAALGDLLSAVTYLKRAEDAPRFRDLLRERGLGNLPNTVVHAAVCRPDLLCEMEAIAALPVGDRRTEGHSR